MLKDGKTGVLAVGSFEDPMYNITQFATTLLNDLQKLKDSGAEQLVVDVVSEVLFPVRCIS